MSFGSTVTVSYPSTCEMTLTTSGKPDYTPNAYYLAPAGTGQTSVAYTSVTNTALAVISYASVIAPSLEGSSATINICPAPGEHHHRHQPRRHRLSHLRHRHVQSV